jgi:hypothetical protein
MRFLIGALLLILSFSSLGQDKITLKNDREGESFYQSRSVKKAINRALKSVSAKEILDSFKEVISSTSENKLCAFDLNSKLSQKIKAIDSKFDDFDGVLYYLRSQNELDDISLKILLRSLAVEVTDLNLPKDEQDLWLPRDANNVSQMLKVIEETKSKLRESCLDEVYRTMYGEILKIDKSIKSYHFEALFVEAYEKKLINFKTYESLEKARINELEKFNLDLKAYYKKIKSLRTNSPLRDPNEYSDFTTSKFDKKSSRRQHLLEQYSDLQILLMSGVIKKLRTRLESPKVEILVYENESVGEVITLEPMERFRFAIKVLRKEMKMLSINTYFNGVAPDYLDLMTAAYETGVIPAVEMQEIASLEDIWNPKKTFWEKARFWVQTFGTVATLVIPPPYGFIPALALVVIEATTNKKNNNSDDTGIF